MKEVKIKLSNRAAQAYQRANQKERQRVDKVVNEIVEYVLHAKAIEEFLDARNVLSQEAIKNGLTPEILDAILSEEK